jgi:REP element-mobilizing transposase RayT
MARHPRSLLPDGFFHVTARGVDGCPIFGDDDDRRRFLELVAEVVERWRWRCHALCLMPNHYHLVVESLRRDLSSGLHRLNGVYAQGFNHRHARTGHLFGDRFHARTIESEEYLVAACLYVVANPVRAGLCAEAEDWPWARSRWAAGPG